MRQRQRGMTFVEILVVIAVIAILLAILLPSMRQMRARANTAKCIGNLRQCALATASYSLDYRDCLPYPVTGHPVNGQIENDEPALWFTAIDPYLVTPGPDDPSRSGVAGQRSFRKWKECPVWEGFPPTPAKPQVNTNQTIKEYSRTIKMNSHLRRIGGDFARNTDLVNVSQFVLYADGTSYDLIDWSKSTSEAGQFSLDVNGGGVGGIAIRHLGGANVVFADGHASTEKYPTYQRLVGSSGIQIPSWESEFVNAAGTPVTSGIDGKKSMEAQGLRRNSKMPLIWSIPGRLYRP